MGKSKSKKREKDPGKKRSLGDRKPAVQQKRICWHGGVQEENVTSDMGELSIL